MAMMHNSEVMSDKFNSYKTCTSVISTSWKYNNITTEILTDM